MNASKINASCSILNNFVLIKWLNFQIFRDKKDWKGLASYYLKMVVILEILKDSGKEYWKNGNMYQRLLDVNNFYFYFFNFFTVFTFFYYFVVYLYTIPVYSNN